jgi:hypothetical protein
MAQVIGGQCRRRTSLNHVDICNETMRLTRSLSSIVFPILLFGTACEPERTVAGSEIGRAPRLQPGAGPRVLQAGELARLTRGQRLGAEFLVPAAFLNARDLRVSVDDESVASISADGGLQALELGTTRVDYRIGELTLSGTVSVISTESSDPTTVSSVIRATASRSITFANAPTVVDSGRTENYSINPIRSRTRSAPVPEWSSSNANVATITTAGALFARAAGETVVTVRAEGESRSVRVTVQSPRRVALAMSPKVASLFVGDTLDVGIALTDETGRTIASEACSLFSGDANRASVSGRRVRAMGAGMVIVVAACQQLRDTAVLSIRTVSEGGGPPIGCYNGAIAPIATSPSGSAILPRELPAACVSVPRRQVRVAANGNLQAALDAAQPGDELLLANNAVFIGNFVLRARAGTEWISIRSSTMDPSLTPGERSSPARASGQATILTPNSLPAISTEPRAARYYLRGLQVSNQVSATDVTRLVELGSTEENDAARTPSSIVLDQLYVHASGGVQLRRCVSLQSAHTAVINSYITECNNRGFDSQSIGGWNGPGPYLIENNYLEAATEPVLFGGGQINIAGQLPSDIVIRRNHITRPDSLKGNQLVKNLVEFKTGVRALVEGNVIERNWIDGQSGWAVVMSPEGLNSWSKVTDITIRSNIFRKVGSWILLKTGGAFHPERISLLNNVVYDLNVGQYTGGGFAIISENAVKSLELVNNTIVSGDYAFQTSSNGFDNLRIVNNIFAMPSAGGEPFYTPRGAGTLGLNFASTSWTFGGNAFAGVWTGTDSSRYPSGNTFLLNLSALQFRSWQARDLQLGADSPALSRGIGGSIPGANVVSVGTATAGVARN